MWHDCKKEDRPKLDKDDLKLCFECEDCDDFQRVKVLGIFRYPSNKDEVIFQKSIYKCLGCGEEYTVAEDLDEFDDPASGSEPPECYDPDYASECYHKQIGE